MNVVNETILVTRNARDKIQVAIFILEQEGNTYIIKRLTGQFAGKFTEQPEKVIERGKAKRSVLLQAELEYNSLIKKSLDKGYKKLSDLTKIKFKDISAKELDSLVPTIKTDTSGNIKPQLAKSSNDCTINSFDKGTFCSRKIDGVRALLKWDEERDEVISVSRGGQNYDIATTHIRNNKFVVNYLKNNPNTIFDGELYVHGWSLQRISGTCRLKTWEDRCYNLQFWMFDIADSETDFNTRLDTLTDIGLYFEDDSESPIVMVEHILLTGWNSVKKYHDKWVKEGFEGLVSRKPYKKYQPGKRSSDWIKLKDYKEDSFKIIGFEDGLRPEDFCFVLEAKNGKSFKAKPIGTREDKELYMSEMDEIIGKQGEVKYFSLSTDGIPTQPIFKAVRYDISNEEE